MRELILGLIGSSSKENEHRVPIHPRHFEHVDADLRARMVVEEGYGVRFGVSDDAIAALVGSIASRSGVISAADIVLLPKPRHKDVEALRDHAAASSTIRVNSGRSARAAATSTPSIAAAVGWSAPPSACSRSV